MDGFIKRLESLKITLDTFLTSRQITQEQLSSQIMMSTLNQLQVEFLLKAIGEQEKLEISDQEVTKTIEATEDEKIRTQMKKDDSYRLYLKQMLLKQKVLEFLFDL
jgi:FKBP-type peptidyl-prolyl cis-trans isomerase (trigger factor)